MSPLPLHQMALDSGEDASLFSSKVFFTGLSFALFGIVGLLVQLTCLPVLYLLPIGRKKRQRYFRRLLSNLFSAYVRFMELCGLIQVNTRVCKKPGSDGQLIVANHPSLLDAVYLISLFPNASCIVKSALFINPFTAGSVRAAGYIRNDSEDLLEECAASLAAGDSLITFPEGTRTDPATPFKFLRGPANIALRANYDICPIVIRCSPARLMKHQAWYEASSETLKIEIEAFPCVSIASYLALGLPHTLLARRLTADLEDFYRKL
jgi:1-acyl-sn-glycerol-3-phosphate acyltransferase